MEKEDLAQLESAVKTAVDSWKGINSKKMFGCPAFWVNGNVFALVWKHGRIGVKLTDSKTYDSLMEVKGSEPWKAGPMKMAHWVLVPEKLHKGGADLKKWLKNAYEQNAEAPPKTKTTKAKKR